MAEPVTNAQLYNTAYFNTHQQLLQQSIKLAEKEFLSLADRIEMLEGKVADYERALATGYMTSSATKKTLVSESEVSGRIRLQEARRAREEKDYEDLNKSLDKSFDITRFNMPDVRNTMEAQMRSGKTVTRAVDDAMANIGGKGAGKDLMQRYVLSKALLQNAKSAATAQGKSFTEAQLRAQIAGGMGVDANTMLLSDEKIKEQLAKPERDRIKAYYESLPEIGDITRITTTEQRDRVTKEKEATEQKLKELEQKMTDRYGDDVDLGKIIERGRQIYSEQYAPLTGAQRRALRKQKTVEQLSPNARRNYEAFQAVSSGDEKVVSLFESDYDDDQIAKAARQIVAAKQSGRDTDVRRLAADLTDNNDDALKALGIAMHYVFNNEGVPNLGIPETESQGQKGITDTGAAMDEAAREQGISLGAIEREAKGMGIDMSGFDDLFSNRISDGEEVIRTQEADTSVVEIPDSTKTRREKEFEALMATRPPRQVVLLRQLADQVGGAEAFMREYDGIKSAKPGEIITTEMMLDQIKPPKPFDFSKRESKTLEELVEGVTGVKPQPTEPSEIEKTLEQKAADAGVTTPAGPEFGKTYYKDGGKEGFGYQFVDEDTVQFVFKDGRVKKQKFGKDTQQYKDAMEYYNKTGK